MKLMLFALFCLIPIHLCYACDSTKMNNVYLLDVKDIKLTNLLSEVYSKTKYQYNWNKSVFVFRHYKTVDNINEIRIAILYKDDFGWLLRDKTDKIFGYFEFEGYPVLVFGESSYDFFLKTQKYVKFDWLKALPPRKELEEGEIPEPSIRFEPDVWVYKYIDGEFIFDSKGFFNIIE